jgi:hypothetical protein
MARTTDVWKFLMLGMLAPVTQVALAQAPQTPQSQQSQQAQQAPSQAPPQRLERIEEGSDTPITVTPPQQTRQKITEKRVDGGRTTEVEVTTGKSTYTMKANPPDAVLQPNDPATGSLRPPQWKVFEFDLFKKKQGEAADTAAAPPPPAPAAK